MANPCQREGRGERLMGVECEPAAEGSEGKPQPKGREEDRHTGRRRRRRGANHRHKERWREFIVMLLHFILRRGTATSPKEDRGREHPKEAEGGSTTKRRRESQREGESTPAQKKVERDKLFFGEGWCFFSCLGWERVLFPCLPLGGADFPLLPCWMVPFSFFFF